MDYVVTATMQDGISDPANATAAAMQKASDAADSMERLADISAGLAANLAAAEQANAVQSAQIAALAKSIDLLTRATAGAADGIAAQLAEVLRRLPLAPS